MKRSLFIWAALLGLVVVIVTLVAGSLLRQNVTNDTGETRRAVEASIQDLLPENAASASDPALLAAADKLAQAPYVARLWVVDEAGKILVHHNGPGKVGDEVRGLSGQDGRSLVAALSSEDFSGPQALQVYTAMALMAEGEHNDVFRPLVQPVKNAAGRVVGAVGLSYDASSSLSTPQAGMVIVDVLFLLGLAAYWLCLPAWTYLDAQPRGEPAVLWGVFVLVANLAGLVAYLLLVSRKKT